MKTLLVLPFMPAKNADKAGHRLSYDIIRTLCKAGEVHLFLIVRQAEKNIPPELVALCGAQNIQVHVMGNKDILKEMLAGGWRDYPRLSTRHTRAISGHLLAYCEKQRFTTVRFEFSQTFKYASDLKKTAAGLAAKIQLSIHDLQIQVILRKRSLESWLFYWAYITECKMLKAADQIIVLSEKDKVFVHNLLDISSTVTVAPPSLSPFVYTVDRTPGGVRKNTLLFWGAMNRVENEAAVLYFVQHVLEKLRAAGYLYQLNIVGSKPGPKVEQLACDHIHVTGFLEDPSAYFASSAIGIVPLSMGAGVKLKTLELLQAGLPVLATPVGAEGIADASGRLRVMDLADFERELVQLYEQ
ncbi:glycosyltransferase family 4 protein [Duganella sp. FT27W]|uniref:glycosyltransferase family 4 protein n=1 Tax=Duganella sp. FT27W TaxID=2654636 RepID=UPI00186BADDD|nr:glycosyltransferase family 4 protein [Duganella sp. FT27W]